MRHFSHFLKGSFNMHCCYRTAYNLHRVLFHESAQGLAASVTIRVKYPLEAISALAESQALSSLVGFIDPFVSRHLLARREQRPQLLSRRSPLTVIRNDIVIHWLSG